jgi:predicted phage-related endonuclease
MHAIYTRLIELIEKDPNNIDELEDWINSALELSDSEEECMALTNAVTHAKKEILLIDLSKQLLGVPNDINSKIPLTRTQIEIMNKIYADEQRKQKYELTNDRF